MLEESSLEGQREACAHSAWSISNAIWDQFHEKHKNTLDTEEESILSRAAL